MERLFFPVKWSTGGSSATRGETNCTTGKTLHYIIYSNNFIKK